MPPQCNIPCSRVRSENTHTIAVYRVLRPEIILVMPLVACPSVFWTWLGSG